MSDLNSEFFKYILVLISAPFWVPFVKAVWEELNDALRNEGGLFGAEPTADQLVELNLEKGEYVSPMVSVAREAPGTRGRATHRAIRLHSEPERLATRDIDDPLERDTRSHGFERKKPRSGFERKRQR